jgi:hypothetical protein
LGHGFHLLKQEKEREREVRKGEWGRIESECVVREERRLGET